MSHDKVITVLGATGTQGGAVVRALLTDGEFTVRAVTRNAASPKAQELARLGAHVVEANLADEGSLRRAFDGAYGAFLVTPYWEHRSPARELAEVENLVGAAQAAGLRHVVWSTLEDTREVIEAGDDRMPVIGEGYRVPHFDVAVHLPLGDTAIAGVASEDIGQVALRVFQQPAQTIGATIPVVGEYLTGEQMTAALGAALGEPVAYRPPTPEQFRSFGFPGADELGNMFQYYAEFPESYLGRRDVEAARVFNPNPLSLTDFLAAHRAELGNAEELR